VGAEHIPWFVNGYGTGERAGEDMMGELERIEDQLRRGLEGGAWHGPAVLELLAGVTAAQAHARPIPGARGIWELVLHVGGAYRLVLRRLRGDATPLAPDEDWPPVPVPSEANWTAAVEGLRSVNAEVRRAVIGFDPGQLDAPLVADPPYSAYTQFVGLIPLPTLIRAGGREKLSPP
jgi:DinB superfamily